MFSETVFKCMVWVHDSVFVCALDWLVGLDQGIFESTLNRALELSGNALYCFENLCTLCSYNLKVTVILPVLPQMPAARLPGCVPYRHHANISASSPPVTAGQPCFLLHHCLLGCLSLSIWLPNLHQSLLTDLITKVPPSLNLP